MDGTKPQNTAAGGDEVAMVIDIQGAAKKTYQDKKLIFSQTDRKFKTKFSTLIPDIYAHISIKYYWKILINQTMRLI